MTFHNGAEVHERAKRHSFFHRKSPRPLLLAMHLKNYEIFGILNVQVFDTLRHGSKIW